MRRLLWEYHSCLWCIFRLQLRGDYAADRHAARYPQFHHGLCRRVWSLVLTTVATAIVSALVTGSSYLSMIIPAELLAPAFKEKGLAAKNMSRIIEESGGIIVPLIPWSMAGVYITGTIGVPTLSYLPWAVMNYASVAILILFGVTGFTMTGRKREYETQAGS